MNWTHGASLSPSQAVSQVASLKCNLSRSLHPEVQQAQPQVFQVWFEPAPKPAGGGQTAPPATLHVLDGELEFTPQTMAWASTHAAGSLTELFAAGGRVLIRIHCGHLYDTKRRQFSAALDAIVTLESLRLPGGVHESWFFIKR